jgi:TPR repeat protein
MQATATKSDALTGKQLDTLTMVFHGDCASNDDWTEDNGSKVIQGINAGYETLSEKIAYRYFSGEPAWKFSTVTAQEFESEAGTYCPNADLGHPDAQKRVGDILFSEFYSQETPSNRDLKRAYVWYRLSYESGCREAGQWLNLVESELTSVQLAEARKMYAQWKPGNCQADLMSKVANADEWKC